MEIAAGQSKSQCLKLMDRVQQTKEDVVITNYGVPVARLVPIDLEPSKPIVGWMKNSVKTTGDIVAPLDETWEADG